VKLITTAFSPRKESFVTDKVQQFGTNSDSALYNGPFNLERNGMERVYHGCY